MKNVLYAVTGAALAIITVLVFRLLFIRPCNSYSSPTEQINETRCKCLGKTIDFADFFGDPDVYSSNPHYDQCIGVVYKKINL